MGNASGNRTGEQHGSSYHRMGYIDKFTDGFVYGWATVDEQLEDNYVRIEISNKPHITVTPDFDAADLAPDLGAKRFGVRLDKIVQPDDIIIVYIGDTHHMLGGENPIRIKGRGTERGSAMERDQVQDMIAASEARADAKFERLIGEVRLIQADVKSELAVVRNQTAGLKANIIISAITIFFGIAALLMSMASYGDAIFGRGMSVRDVIKTNAEEQSKAIEAAVQSAVQKAIQAAREADAPKPPATKPE